MSTPTTYKHPAAAHVANTMADAKRAWEALSPAQQRALLRSHAFSWPRIRLDTHARTKTALRAAGIVEPVGGFEGDRDLTIPGALVRWVGMAAGTRTREENHGT